LLNTQGRRESSATCVGHIVRCGDASSRNSRRSHPPRPVSPTRDRRFGRVSTKDGLLKERRPLLGGRWISGVDLREDPSAVNHRCQHMPRRRPPPAVGGRSCTAHRAPLWHCRHSQALAVRSRATIMYNRAADGARGCSRRWSFPSRRRSAQSIRDFACTNRPWFDPGIPLRSRGHRANPFVRRLECWSGKPAARRRQGPWRQRPIPGGPRTAAAMHWLSSARLLDSISQT